MLPPLSGDDSTRNASPDGPTGDGIGEELTRNIRGELTASTPPIVIGGVHSPGELALPAGLRIRHYEIIRELGRGGMGQVMVARDLRLGRLVAMKFLAALSPQFTERFLVEARATARCHHENIVIVFEVDEYADHPYMVLELLDGQPLSKVIARGPLAARRAVDLAIPVARALVRAHEQDIIHRDLKPDNVFVTRSGQVKVLDFGVAKLYQGAEPDGVRRPPVHADPGDLDALRSKTAAGAVVGTLPYMSPEQCGLDAVDHRTDLWAMGVLLWQMLADQHPLGSKSPHALWAAVTDLEAPVRSIAAVRPDLPATLVELVDRCLIKRKIDRMASARDLLAALEHALPAPTAIRLDDDDCPFLGLQSFQESDAGRFFGRARDVAHLVARVHDEPLVALAGPSGVGKSSLVRAGVVPALHASGEAWEVLTLRPGRAPMTAVATALRPLLYSPPADPVVDLTEHDRLLERLTGEPGYLGVLLRARARQRNGRVLLFVDQLEELYTLVDDPAQRRAFTASLVGAADDAGAPVRIVVSIRSDFLDRAVEDQAFMDQMARGMVFVPPVDRDGLREALVQPLDLAGYRFESTDMVDRLVTELAQTPGALPLLQFTAAGLWDLRDRVRRLLPRSSYDTLGGVGGTLAHHADQVLAAMSSPRQRVARVVFQRLVTAAGTRAIVDIDELAGLGAKTTEVTAVIDVLVAARLIVVQQRGDGGGPTAELVHESLIARWPTLQRWLEEGHEDALFLEQLTATARQWDGRARDPGMVWQGEAADEAIRFARRFTGELSGRERAYLDAVIALAGRTARRRRAALFAIIFVLAALVAAAAVALVWIRAAELTARNAAEQAATEAERARSAEDDVTKKNQELMEKESQRRSALANAEAQAEHAKVNALTAEVEKRNAEEALTRARAEEAKAKEAEKAEKAARELAQRLAAEATAAQNQLAERLKLEKEKVDRLEKEKAALTTVLKRKTKP